MWLGKDFTFTFYALRHVCLGRTGKVLRCRQICGVSIAVSTYPGRHFCHGFALCTKMQMQNDDGNENSKDAQADDEYEILHYTHTHAAFY